VHGCSSGQRYWIVGARHIAAFDADDGADPMEARLNVRSCREPRGHSDPQTASIPVSDPLAVSRGSIAAEGRTGWTGRTSRSLQSRASG
jgi:hypothetical protein